MLLLLRSLYEHITASTGVTPIVVDQTASGWYAPFPIRTTPSPAVVLSELWMLGELTDEEYALLIMKL